jgi:hypothetical protein
MEKRNYNFDVEVIHVGQKRAYGDTFNDYKITINHELSAFKSHNDLMVENFCKSIVSKPVRFIDSPCHFDSKETFEKIDDKTYIYHQVIPSTH